MHRILSAFALCTLLAVTNSGSAYTFTRIAGTNTSIPNGSGTFAGFSNAQIQQSNVVFAATGASSQKGFYRWKNGSLTRLVDMNSTLPPNNAGITTLPDYDGRLSEVNDFLFSANTTEGKGLYRWNGFNDTFSMLVDTTFDIPGTSGKFSALRSLYQVQPPGRTVFVGYNSNFNAGIYFLSDTNVTTLIGPGGSLPNTSATFVGSDYGVLQSGSGGNVAFRAFRSDNSAAIYCYSYTFDDTFLVVDTNTVAPGQSAKFVGFSEPVDLENGTIVFYGSFSGGAGLFSAAFDGGSLTKLVDTTMTVPGTTNHFSSLVGGFDYKGGKLLFYSSYFDNEAGRSRPGIYLLDGGTITTVVDTFTTLDGETPTNLGLGGMDSSGNIVFTASFSSGAKGVYTTLPVVVSNPVVQFTLTTNVVGGGAIQLSPDSADGKYDSNTLVQATAVAADGYAFKGWSGALTSVVNPVQFAMTTNKTLTATFTNIPVPGMVTLTTNVSPAGYGSITVDPSGTSFASNSVVMLTANPAAGKVFAHWSGASTSRTNPLQLTLNGNKTITAVFSNAPPYYTITTAITPDATGTISLSPPPGTNGYAAGTAVTITATPNTGYKFVKWSGSSAALANKIVIKMTANKTLTANFAALAQYQLTVNLNPPTAGTVIKSPTPVSGTSYYAGTHVSLTAVPATGFKFVKWVGQVLPSANLATVTMNANKTVTAVFASVPVYQLTAAVTPNDAGIVFADPAPATNGYSSNAIVTLSMTPNGTNQFVAWTGGASGFSNQVQVTMNSNKTVTAVFNTPGKIYWQSLNSFVSLWLMENTNFVGSALLNNGKSIARAWRLASTIDFDNNGSKDLLFQNNSGAVMLWMMTNNFITRTQALKTAPLGMKLIGAGNFTTNTSPDLLWQKISTGALTIWTYGGTNGATYTGQQVINSTVAPGTTWKAVAVADFNNDGNSDIVFQNTDRRVMVWLMNGTTMTSSVVLNENLAAPAGWTIGGVSDLDDNGTPDLLFQVTGGKSATWLMNNTNIIDVNFLANGGAMPTGWNLRAGK